jgi:methyl-accepting chemotaxis protein
VSEPPAIPAAFKGLSRWITQPSLFGGLCGAALAVTYALATLERPPGTTLWFLAIVTGFVVAATLRGDVQEQGALGTVRAVGAGKRPADDESFRRSLRELFAFPDRAFWINFQNWGAGTVAIGLVYQLVPGVPWSVSLRICFLGLALAPISSLVTHLLVLRRCRKAMASVVEAGGISPHEILRVCPPNRLQLRRRLILFTAIVVLTPNVLIADIAIQRTERMITRMLESSSRLEQAQALEAGEYEGLVPIGALAAMVIAVIFFTSYISGSALGQPMREISVEARRIASGDLRSARIVFAEDEVWAASAAFATMHSQLTSAISQLKTAGFKLSTTSEQLVATSGKHEDGATEQATALTETSATTEELARSARQIAGNAQSVAQMAEQTLSAAQAGMRSAEAFFLSMGRTRQGNQAIADSVVKLNKRVQQIGRIIEFINGIADKTDLLAVNAELEGTKAGDVGRGFSLVAAEMRRLAESVIDSTREIARLIEEIRDATNAAVMATEAGVKATDRGSALSARVTENLRSILDLARQTSDAVRSISLATHQQQTGTDQLAEAMNDILRSTQAGAAATREVAGANADLSNLAKDLDNAVQRFQVRS